MYRRGKAWYIDKRLPGYGRFGPISTQTHAKSRARAIEGMVVELNNKGRRDVLTMIAEHATRLPEAYAVYIEKGLTGLDDLVDSFQVTEDDLPLPQAIEQFMAVVQDPRYRSTYNWIETEAPPDAPLSWLADPETIQRLLNKRLAVGMKPATVARDKAAISALLGHHLGEAKRREILHKRVRVKQANAGRIRWLTQNEIERLREVSSDWWVVWCFLLSTGVRRGEALAAHVDDVDFETGQLRVWGTKSEAAERMVPLEGEIVALLRGQIAANGLDRHDLLFPNIGRNRGWYVWRAWRDCCTAARIEGATVHDLRHTFAVHAVKAGMPLPELQRRLGHSKMKETWRYASFAPPANSEHINIALDRMGLSGLPTDIPTLRRKAL